MTCPWPKRARPGAPPRAPFSLEACLVCHLPNDSPGASAKSLGAILGPGKQKATWSGWTPAMHYPEFPVPGVQSPWTCLIPLGRRFLLIRSSVTNTDKEMKKGN